MNWSLIDRINKLHDNLKKPSSPGSVEFSPPCILLHVIFLISAFLSVRRPIPPKQLNQRKMYIVVKTRLYMMTSLIVRPEKDRIGYVIIYNNHVKVNLRPKFLNVIVISRSNYKNRFKYFVLFAFWKDKPLMERFFPIFFSVWSKSICWKVDIYMIKKEEEENYIFKHKLLLGKPFEILAINIPQNGDQAIHQPQ